jgi:sec-independent protein translocase protein TatA
VGTIFLFIGFPEMVVVGLLVVLVFGADKIPEIARGLGKGIRQMKDATADIKREINDTASRHKLDTDIAKDVNKEVNDIKQNIDDFTGPIKRNK